jgi:hypothetical protein
MTDHLYSASALPADMLPLTPRKKAMKIVHRKKWLITPNGDNQDNRAPCHGQPASEQGGWVVLHTGWQNVKITFSVV